MTGEKVKSLIFSKGYSVAQVAEMIGTSQQNLSASLKHTDIRSGLIEKIAEALDMKLADFYGPSFGSCSESVKGSLDSASEFIATTDKLLELLKVKDEQLTLAMQQTSVAQAQMDRVIDAFQVPRSAPVHIASLSDELAALQPPAQKMNSSIDGSISPVGRRSGRIYKSRILRHKDPNPEAD